MLQNDFPAEFRGLTDPFKIFKTWLDEARQCQLKEPTSFILSTVNTQGQPSSRVVLCKEIQDEGFVFYTNYKSTKGKNLEENPLCSACFFWDPLLRQIKFKGRVQKLTPEKSIEYWASRPRDSQLSQWVSKQSSPATSRQSMEEELKKAELQFTNQEIPCPEHWGGYLIIPHEIEFWIGRSGRFHDRVCYSKVQKQWTAQRLYP